MLYLPPSLGVIITINAVIITINACQVLFVIYHWIQRQPQMYCILIYCPCYGAFRIHFRFQHW